MASPRSRSYLPTLVAVAFLSGCFVAGGPAPASTPGLTEGPHEVMLNGVRHWYRVAGSAQPGVAPIVFLHGGPGQGSIHFAELVGPRLEPSMQLVYFDQRGSGRSERPANGEYTLPLLVKDLEALRVALEVPKISLIGHSFGGTLALEYAAAHPEHVGRVVIVAGLWDAPLQCRLRLQTLARLRPAAYARVRTDTLNADGTRRHDCDLEFSGFTSQEEREAYSLEAMHPDLDVHRRIDEVEAAHGYRNTGEMGGALFRDGLMSYRFDAHDRLTMPVLLIAGRLDGAVRPEGLRILADGLPNARYLEYGQSGHFVYLDEPERFARDVVRFLTASP